ncbi:MAG: hypothetical protein AAFR17_08340 [Pseudomonadota bacterium]
MSITPAVSRSLFAKEVVDIDAAAMNKIAGTFERGFVHNINDRIG